MCVPVPSVVSPAPLQFSVIETRQQKHNTIQYLHMLHHTCRRLLRNLFSCDVFKLGLPRRIFQSEKLPPQRAQACLQAICCSMLRSSPCPADSLLALAALWPGALLRLPPLRRLSVSSAALGRQRPRFLSVHTQKRCAMGPRQKRLLVRFSHSFWSFLPFPASGAAASSSYMSVLISAHPELLRQGPVQDATCALQPLLPELVAPSLLAGHAMIHAHACCCFSVHTHRRQTTQKALVFWKRVAPLLSVRSHASIWPVEVFPLGNSPGYETYSSLAVSLCTLTWCQTFRPALISIMGFVYPFLLQSNEEQSSFSPGCTTAWSVTVFLQSKIALSA